MPITLPPISRRRFLAGSVAAGLTLAASRYLRAADDRKPDPDHIVLISDSHIDANPGDVELGINMTDQLRAILAAVVALPSRPSMVLHGGDLAHTSGETGDYAAFLGLVKPVQEAGVPLHLMLGNHDHRERFWLAVPTPADAPEPVEHKHVARIESARADWYLLDTLDQTNMTPGLLGEKQLAWLAKTLDANPTKPAIVFTHHHPLDQYQRVTRGIADTKELLAILSPRKQVKLLVFGHTHDWTVNEKQPNGLHRINLPPTAFVFDKARPRGWVDVHLTDRGASVQLISLDEKHPQHLEKHELMWRA